MIHILLPHFQIINFQRIRIYTVSAKSRIIQNFLNWTPLGPRKISKKIFLSLVNFPQSFEGAEKLNEEGPLKIDFLGVGGPGLDEPGLDPFLSPSKQKTSSPDLSRPLLYFYLILVKLWRFIFREKKKTISVLTLTIVYLFLLSNQQQA